MKNPFVLAFSLIAFMFLLAFPRHATGQYLTAVNCTAGTGGPNISGCLATETTNSGMIDIAVNGTCSSLFQAYAFQIAGDSCYFPYVLKVWGTGANTSTVPNACPVDQNQYLGVVHAYATVSGSGGTFSSAESWGACNGNSFESSAGAVLNSSC